jgi:hypothetical protein
LLFQLIALHFFIALTFTDFILTSQHISTVFLSSLFTVFIVPLAQ